MRHALVEAWRKTVSGRRGGWWLAALAALAVGLGPAGAAESKPADGFEVTRSRRGPTSSAT
jgi:hypothetical protein